MPIKSKAQRRKFAQLLVEGKISPETFEEWNRGAGKAELPERLHPKKKTSGQSRKKKATSRRANASKSRGSTKKKSKPRPSRAKSSSRKRR